VFWHHWGIPNYTMALIRNEILKWIHYQSQRRIRFRTIPKSTMALLRHISRFVQTWHWPLPFSAYYMCSAVPPTHPYFPRPVRYNTYLHVTNSPHHFVTSFFGIPDASLSHVHAVIHITWPSSANPKQYLKILCVPKRRSQRTAFVRNVSSSLHTSK
jgi:hypothetical protein